MNFHFHNFHYRFNRLKEKNYKSFQDDVPNFQKSNSTEASIFDSIYDTTISMKNEVENYLITKCEHQSTDPLLCWKQNLDARDFFPY